MSKYEDWKSKETIENEFRDSEGVSEETMLPNDMKDGDLILQTNGWYGEIVDNARGIRRIANIHGYFTEAGSIFVWDIDLVLRDGEMYKLEMPESYKKQRDRQNELAF